MATIFQPPRLQLGDAPLPGYAGSEKDQFALIWQTTGTLSTDQFVVEYRPVGSTDWIAAPTTTTINTGVDTRVNHTVTVTGVDYNTVYEYRVQQFQDGQLVSTYQDDFKTRLAAGDSRGFTFAAYGDSAGQASQTDFLRVQNRINLINPDFALLLGDNAYDYGSHADYDYRFNATLAPDAIDWQSDHIDFAAVGNHDILTAGGKPYQDSYEVPIPVAGVDSPTAPTGVSPELNYSFDYGNVHFVTFDSNVYQNPTALDNILKYVEADLAASTAKWKIVFAHHPIAGYETTPSDDYYRQVVTRLNAVGADLLLVGHSHTFRWTYPLTGYSGSDATFVQDTDKVYDKGAGLIQAVVGIGGDEIGTGSYALPYMASAYSLSTARPAEFGFARIAVTDQALSVDYVAADDGEIIDSFKVLDPNAITRAVFQNGVDGYQGTVDTYLRAASPTTSQSTAALITVDGDDAGGAVQGLLRFDNLFGNQAGQIPVGADIQAAFIELQVTNPGNALQVYEMRQSWADTATWSSFGNGIQVDGVEASSTAIATTAPTVSTGTLTLNVTQSLQAWANDPTQNRGWVFLPTGSDGVDFSSAEGSIKPRLVVKYTRQSGNNSNIAPSITSVTDNVGPFTGPIANAGRTDDATPTFTLNLTGTNAVAGNTLRLFNNITQIAAYVLTTTDIANNSASMTTEILDQGFYSVTAQITDVFGNEGAASTARTFTIDTTAPNAPTIASVTDNVGSIQGDVVNNGRTNDTTPTMVVGLADTGALAGDTLRLFNGSTQISSYVLSATDITNNSVSITTSTLAQGVYSLTAQITDGVGNQGAASAARTFTIDTVAPNAPAIASVTDNVGLIQGEVVNGGRTNDTTPTVVVSLAGTGALVGDTLRLFNGSTQLISYVLTDADITANSTTITLASQSTTSGRSYSLTARLTDVAGNQGPASVARTFTLDTSAPKATVMGFTPTSAVGTAEANGTIALSTSSSSPTTFAATALASATGTFGLDVSTISGSTAGTNYYVYTWDVAGNISSANSRRVVIGTSGNDSFSTSAGSSSTDLLNGGAGTDLAKYSVSSGAISRTGQIATASGTIAIAGANIDILTGMEQLQFTNAGYTSTTSNPTPSTNQLLNSVQTSLVNNSVAAFVGAYDAATDTFTFGVGVDAGANATLLTYDSNAGSSTNFESFLVLGKTSPTLTLIQASSGTVTLSGL